MVAVIERMVHRISAGFHRSMRESTYSDHITSRPRSLSREERRAIGQEVIAQRRRTLEILAAHDRGEGRLT